MPINERASKPTGTAIPTMRPTFEEEVEAFFRQVEVELSQLYPLLQLQDVEFEFPEALETDEQLRKQLVLPESQ